VFLETLVFGVERGGEEFLYRGEFQDLFFKKICQIEEYLLNKGLTLKALLNSPLFSEI